MLKDKLEQFIDNTNGQFIEISSKEAIYQCMDLAYLWVFILGFPKATIQNQYAYQVYTNPKEITNQYFEIIPNTPEGIPEDGDIVVFKGGVAGHIVIALGGGSTDKFIRFEQNSPLGTNAHLKEGNYTNCLGWLRPKPQPLSQPVFTNQTLIPLQEFGQKELQAVVSELRELKRLRETPVASPSAPGHDEEVKSILYGKGWPWTKINKIKALLPQ